MSGRTLEAFDRFSARDRFDATEPIRKKGFETSKAPERLRSAG